MTTWGLRTFAVAGLLAVSCGSIHGVATAPGTASAGRTTPASSARLQSPCPVVQPTPQFPASAPSSRNLALVTLRGSNNIIVRDITDIAHPTTVNTLGTIQQPQFVSATVLTYIDHQEGVDQENLVRVPLVESPAISVARGCQGISAFAWSPDGSTVVYVTPTNSRADVHQLSSTGDRVIGSMPSGGVGGCETYESCTLPNWMDFQLHFSPDGTLISLVIKTFSGTVFRIWSADGKSLEMDDSYGATMSAWSGKALYLRDAKGVSVWRNESISTFLAGVAWIRPSASPGGGMIVYSVRDSAGWAHTYVVDTATARARELNKARTSAVFLTSRYIWYEGERDCQPEDHCGASPAIHPLSGKTYIYDLQDGTETESIITGVADVWPHPA